MDVFHQVVAQLLEPCVARARCCRHPLVQWCRGPAFPACAVLHRAEDDGLRPVAGDARVRETPGCRFMPAHHLRWAAGYPGWRVAAGTRLHEGEPARRWIALRRDHTGCRSVVQRRRNHRPEHGGDRTAARTVSGGRIRSACAAARRDRRWHSFSGRSGRSGRSAGAIQARLLRVETRIIAATTRSWATVRARACFGPISIMVCRFIRRRFCPHANAAPTRCSQAASSN